MNQKITLKKHSKNMPFQPDNAGTGLMPSSAGLFPVNTGDDPAGALFGSYSYRGLIPADSLFLISF
jgi:hypothetical protein